MLTRFPLLDTRRWSFLVAVLLLVVTPTLAVRPEFKAEGKQMLVRKEKLLT